MMNAHEKLVAMFIAQSMSEIIGGWENAKNDSLPDSEEYKEAEKFLTMPHDDLVDYIYSDVMGYMDKGTAKHARFAGTEFIKARISARLKKWGY